MKGGKELMPRIARQNLEGNYFHIIIQGINREYIFQEDNLKDAYLNILRKNLEKTQISVLAYCIMDNHAHFLIYCENFKEISKLMQKNNTSFAILYNKLKNRVGYVFRNRYYTQMILNENQLFNCLVYIHNNPVKAHIVDNPKKYLYSSYLQYLNSKEFITEKSIKLVFGSTKNYIEIFNEIHKNTKNENYIFEPFKNEENLNELIMNYMKNNNTNIEEIKKNEKQLIELLVILKYVYQITYRDIAEVFQFSKDKVYRLIKKKINS